MKPCKYCEKTEHSKLSALTHVCDKDALRERIISQHEILQRIYDNAQGVGGNSLETVTAWQIDTVDYQALEEFLFPDERQ